MRLDNYIVQKGLFNTRNKAQTAIKSGHIYVDNKCIKKCSFTVDDTNKIFIKGNPEKYVSRAGFKLEKAINTFNINLKDKIMCDIGSSTGGFCDCALQNNIKKIYAIDVGSNQMVEKLKKNDKIFLFENTDFRNIDEKIINDATIITIDISFISVTKIIPKIKMLKNVDEIVCLVKPQFECGKQVADKYKGVVLNKKVHFNVILNLINKFNQISFYANGLTYSPIRGGSGNIEYLLYLTKNNKEMKNIYQIVNDAFKLN